VRTVRFLEGETRWPYARQSPGNDGVFGDTQFLFGLGPESADWLVVFAQTRLTLVAFSAFVRNPPSGSMPPFRAKVMSDQELADVYAYIKTIPEPKPAKDIPLLNP